MQYTFNYHPKSKIFALVDCNNFYASCERVFQPRLQGKPIVVLSNNDGCIVARSEEVKKLGIPMGVPIFKMRDLVKLHNIKVFSSNYVLYGDISQRIIQVLRLFSEAIEVYSIDESFLELSNLPVNNWQELGWQIRKTILQWIGVPVSIGIAPTKTLAKAGAKLAKKNPEFQGVLDFTKLTEADTNQLLARLPVNDVWGVGRQHTKYLNNRNVTTALDLKRFDNRFIKTQMTVQGQRTILELNGISCLPLNHAPSAKKNIASTRSFSHDVTALINLQEAVTSYCEQACIKLRRQHSVAHYVLIFILTNRHKTNTPQYSNSTIVKIPYPSSFTPLVTKAALHGLQHIFKPHYAYKKAGVMLLGIEPDTHLQYDLTYPNKEVTRQHEKKIMQTVDLINHKIGHNAVFLASRGVERKWSMRSESKSRRFTTNWGELPVIKI
ncbi:MAG: Y-family DNA polymerase [bacterium]